jgi:antirestriction protein ArdC
VGWGLEVESWLKALKNDPGAVFTAASKAQAAADWVHAQQPNAPGRRRETGLWQHFALTVRMRRRNHERLCPLRSTSCQRCATPTTSVRLKILRDDNPAITRAASCASLLCGRSQ